MPNLRITYGDIEIYNGEVDGFQWDDQPGTSVTVTGRIAKPKTGGALFDLIANASRTKTQAAADKHRQAAVVADTEGETA